MIEKLIWRLLLAFTGTFLVATSLWAAPPLAQLTAAAKSPSETTTVEGLIVAFDSDRTGRANSNEVGTHADRVNIALAAHGRSLTHQRVLHSGADVLRFDQPTTHIEAEAMAKVLAATPGVRYAVVNRHIYNRAVPVDANYTSQWGFQYLPGSAEGANFQSAWDITRGSASQTIGVLDNGIERLHEDLVGQVRLSTAFPNGGYDFVTSATSAGDGDGRDNNPAPPGSCTHGTHVSGTIAANTAFTGSGLGGAGGAPYSSVLMARALGVSSGTDADAIDGMLWLAGATVTGVAVNPNPVRVINMSFGGDGACGGAYQDAFDTLHTLGVVPVVSAGNSNADVSTQAPANCRGAVAVAAGDITGKRASFSNYGTGVTITAPGVGILSTCGTTTGYATWSGTSMASPHVTATVALMLAVAPSLSADAVVLGLRAGARPFPAGSNCTTALCGAGLLDAARSLQTVISPTPMATWAVSGAEVHENDGSVSIGITRLGAASGTISAQVSASNGTAVQGIDYGAPSPSTVAWAAGDTTSRTVVVPITYRSGAQSQRRFSLQLSGATGGLNVVSPASIPVTISDVDCASPLPISFDQTLSGTLDVAQPANYCHGGYRGPNYNTVRYQFSGTAGDNVSIDLLSTTASPPVLDTYLYLLGPDLRVIAENDDIVPGVNRSSQLLNLVLTTTGTHYIDVTTWSAGSDASGSYTVHLYGCHKRYIPGANCNLDVDGDGAFTTTDAQLITRRLFGFSPSVLTTNLGFSACATRTTGAALAAFIDANASGSAPPYDIDGDGMAGATSDGLMLTRVALGLPGTAIVARATSSANWPAVRSYLNGQCGFTLPP